MRPIVLLLTAGVVALLIACGDGTGPGDRSVRISVAAGDGQFGLPDELLDEPLQVRVTDAGTGDAVRDVEVTWRVRSGSASVVPQRSRTDQLGFAQADLRFGGQLGDVTVEATASGLVDNPAMFSARAVQPPVIESVTPTTIEAGGTITITGSGFPSVSDVSVLFAGVRGTVVSGSATTLVVTVPSCVLTRTTEVRVQIGAVASSPATIQTIASGGAGIVLQAGQSTRLSAPDRLACIRFDAAPPGAAYLIVPHNVQTAAGLAVHWELHGRTGDVIPVTQLLGAAPASVSTDWELKLRQRERALLGDDGVPPVVAQQVVGAVAAPEIGDRRQFNVLTRNQSTERITAEVRALSERAVLYVDLQSPAQGFNQQDLHRFGAMFDDPIYTTDVAVFGTPSDVDGNGRIIILFTPKVNQLTEAGQTSFIAGYFYGCDLVPANRCADTNSAEIFYSMVPDPQGEFGDRRSKDLVLSTVPGILAHEFQHMIHFGQKGRLDELWLSEGLAHAAEDIVGTVFLARGDQQTANDFMRPNHVRANRYLAATGTTSLVGTDSPGTLELRGGAWLLVDYLTAHYGGPDLLARLTRAQRNGVSNVTAETGQAWDLLLGNFSVALWADGAPELQNVTVDPLLTFPAFDLRTITGQFAGGFPLEPLRLGFRDFSVSGAMPPASIEHFIVEAPNPEPPPLHMSFTGIRGADIGGSDRGQLTVLRIR